MHIFFEHANFLESQEISAEVELQLVDQLDDALRYQVSSSLDSSGLYQTVFMPLDELSNLEEAGDLAQLSDQEKLDQRKTRFQRSRQPTESIMDKAVRCGLLRYMNHKLDLGPQLTNDELEELLDKALVSYPPSLLMSEKYHGLEITRPILKRTTSTDLAWTHLWAHLYALSSQNHKTRTEQYSTNIVFQITKAFLKNGADTAKTCLCSSEKASNLLLEVEVGEIIRMTLTESQLRALGHLLPPPTTKPLLKDLDLP